VNEACICGKSIGCSSAEATSAGAAVEAAVPETAKFGVTEAATVLEVVGVCGNTVMLRDGKAKGNVNATTPKAIMIGTRTFTFSMIREIKEIIN
jgi:hypothetical protein